MTRFRLAQSINSRLAVSQLSSESNQEILSQTGRSPATNKGISGIEPGDSRDFWNQTRRPETNRRIRVLTKHDTGLFHGIERVLETPRGLIRSLTKSGSCQSILATNEINVDRKNTHSTSQSYNSFDR